MYFKMESDGLSTATVPTGNDTKRNKSIEEKQYNPNFNHLPLRFLALPDGSIY